MTTGRAFRLEIPVDLRGRVPLNILEFLAATVAIWIDIHEEGTPLECYLCQGDSTTAAGWMSKSNFNDVNPAHMEATRKLASILLQSEGLLYSQWFPGIENVVADVLSRDFHIPDDKLISLLSSLVPQQIPPLFHISPVPKEIYSWVISLLRKQPSTKQSPKEPQRSKLLRGRDGRSILHPSASATTPSSTISSRTKETGSYQHSHQQYEQDAFQQNAIADSYARQLPIPSNKYHRPFGLTKGETRSTTLAATRPSFYHANTEDTEIKTLVRNTKWQSLDRS